MSGAALTAACTRKTNAQSESDGAHADTPLHESVVSLPAGDGTGDAFFVHPARGRHPAILVWPDIAGLRDTFKEMARRLARQGYAVLVVNPYYRGARSPVLERFSDWLTDEGKAKIQPLRSALTAEAITRDADAYTRWLLAQDVVERTAKIGTLGFCMGGPFTVWTAAAIAHVGAAASMHGAGLVTDAPSSPHRMLGKGDAAYLFAIAQNDDTKDPSSQGTLRNAAKEAGRDAEIEVYPADHGWTVPDSPAYDASAAERAWQRILALFNAQLTRKT